MVRLHPLAVVKTAAQRVRVITALLAVLLLGWTNSATAQATGRCATGDPQVLAQSAAGRIVFGDKLRMVRLAPACGSIGAAARRAGGKVRFFLVVEDLRASAQPGAIFDISLAPARGRTDHRMRVLGTLNFFNAHPAAAGKGRRVSYDVTRELRALAARDRLSSGLAIAIAPLSAPERASDASTGAIQLVMQRD